MDAKIEERRMHFDMAVAPLETAKVLFEAIGEERIGCLPCTLSVVRPDESDG